MCRPAVWGLGFRVSGVGLSVSGVGCRVSGVGCGVLCLRVRLWGLLSILIEMAENVVRDPSGGVYVSSTCGHLALG